LELIIAPLGKQHDQKSLDCGEPSLNQYLNRYASQDIRRRVNRVFVASSPDAPLRAIGYYSLSIASLDATALREACQRRLPRHPVPVVLMGRLAVAESHQGMGLGSILLAGALQRRYDHQGTHGAAPGGVTTRWKKTPGAFFRASLQDGGESQEAMSNKTPGAFCRASLQDGGESKEAMSNR